MNEKTRDELIIQTAESLAFALTVIARSDRSGAIVEALAQAKQLSEAAKEARIETEIESELDYDHEGIVRAWIDKYLRPKK